MQKAKQLQPYRIYMQYVLIGGAFGLYYGLFYKETLREPDYGIAILLSFMASGVTVIVRSWKKNRRFKEILIDFVKVLSFFLVLMLGLEMRKLIANNGGKMVMVVFSTILGTILGFFAAIKKRSP